jgi:ornithine cyclodeaminase/alanine dehydrogenase-like protein (mu-crystallin family)
MLVRAASMPGKRSLIAFAELAYAVLPSLQSLTVFNRSPERLQNLLSRLRKDFPRLTIEGHLLADETAKETAVKAADVICL